MAEAAERLQWALEYAVWDQSATDEARTRPAAEHLLRRLQQRYAPCSWHVGVAAFTLPLATMAYSSLCLQQRTSCSRGVPGDVQHACLQSTAAPVLSCGMQLARTADAVFLLEITSSAALPILQPLC